jgi:hypothetical protein
LPEKGFKDFELITQQLYYLSEEIIGVLLQRAEDAVKAGTEVEVRRYAA